MDFRELHQRILEADQALQAKEYQKAIELGEAILTEAPNNVPLLRVLGYAEMGNQNFRKARDYFQHSLKHEKNQVRAHCSIAETFSRQYNRKKATQSYQMAVKVAAAHQELTPTMIQSWLTAAQRLKEQGDPKTPVNIGIQKFPNNQRYTPAWLVLALKYGIPWPTVKTAVDLYLAEHPTDVRVSLLEAERLIREQDYRAAMSFLEQKQEKFGEQLYWKSLYGKALSNVIKHDTSMLSHDKLHEVIKLYSALIEAAPESLEGYFEAAKLIVKDDELHRTQHTPITPAKTQALDFLLAVLPNNKNHIDLNIRALSILLRNREFKAVEKRVEQLLEQEPQNYLLLELKSRCFLDQGKISQALDSIEKALAINPSDLTLIKHKAKCFLAQGKYQAASAILLGLVEQSDNCITTRRTLARNEFFLGSFTRCKKLLDNSHPNEQEQTWIEELRSILNTYFKSDTPWLNRKSDRKFYSNQERNSRKQVVSLITGDAPEHARTMTKACLIGAGISSSNIYEEQLLGQHPLTHSQLRRSNWILLIQAGCLLRPDGLKTLFENRRDHYKLVFSGSQTKNFNNNIQSSSAEVVLTQTKDLLLYQSSESNAAINVLSERLNSQYIGGVLWD